MKNYLCLFVLICILSSCGEDEDQAIGCNEFNKFIIGNWVSTNNVVIVLEGVEKVRKYQEDVEFKEMNCGKIFKNDYNGRISDFCFNYTLNCDSGFIRVFEDLLCNELKGIALHGEEIWKVDSISKDRFKYSWFNSYESQGIKWTVHKSCELHRKK